MTHTQKQNLILKTYAQLCGAVVAGSTGWLIANAIANIL